MKKTKLYPKIIRVGDIVEINNPEFFIRCGYPIGIAEMREETQEIFGGVIDDLISSAGKEKFMRKDEKGRYEDGTYVQIAGEDIRKFKGYNEIINALAYERLRSKEFGGNERKIFTERIEKLKGQKAEVTSIKIHKTGKYVKGSSGYDYYRGGYEYDPPSLDGEKTHKILTLDFSPKACYDEEKTFLREHYDDRIEATNVTKIMDKEEYENRCGIIEDLKMEWINKNERSKEIN